MVLEEPKVIKALKVSMVLKVSKDLKAR